ncbi:MAG: type I secretion system permease/ATPase [Alphaproteobacteria bacterium]|nr:type I secretion system permease/ATPase [Alphaproteobacteria bacterium]
MFAAFVGLFINVLHLAVPLYMMQVYDRVMNSRSHDTLLMLTVLVVGAIVFMTTLDFIRSRTFIITAEKLVHRLQGGVFRAAVADALRTQSPNATQATRDLQELRQFITTGPVALPMDAMFSPLLLGVLFLLHPVYGIVAVAGLGGMLLLSLLMEFAARRPSGHANDAALRAHQDVNTAIRHAEVIEGMGMIGAVLRRWQRSQRIALDLVGGGNSAARAISAVSRGFRMGLQVAVLAAGAELAIDALASAGSITAATILMGRFLAPFDQLIDGWRQWTNAGSALGRLRRLLAQHRETRSATPVEAADSRITVERVTFVPNGSDRAVLRSVSFALEPGDVLGIIGPSGAGKSTLARLMVGLWSPSSGRIYLDGQDVFTWERESFGRQVGYLPQNGGLLDGTIRENIARMGEADAAAVVAAARRADVHDMIGRLPLGYETRIGDAGFVLSGGQRQRVALARALFGSPKLLVLDEPNANLDAAGEQSLMKTITECKAAGTTVIIVAHRTSIMAVADKLLVLRDGAVEQFGPRAEVMRSLSTTKTAAAGNVTPLPAERSARA